VVSKQLARGSGPVLRRRDTTSERVLVSTLEVLGERMPRKNRQSAFARVVFLPLCRMEWTQEEISTLRGDFGISLFQPEQRPLCLLCTKPG
jgi:hypothetical protein